MSHEGQEEGRWEEGEVGPGGRFALPHSPLQRSLPRHKKALPLFSPLPPPPSSPLPQHPLPHPPHHPMPSLAPPHAPQDPLAQHQGLQSCGRWEMMWVPAAAATLHFGFHCKQIMCSRPPPPPPASLTSLVSFSSVFNAQTLTEQLTGLLNTQSLYRGFIPPETFNIYLRCKLKLLWIILRFYVIKQQSGAVKWKSSSIRLSFIHPSINHHLTSIHPSIHQSSIYPCNKL